MLSKWYYADKMCVHASFSFTKNVRHFVLLETKKVGVKFQTQVKVHLFRCSCSHYCTREFFVNKIYTYLLILSLILYGYLLVFFVEEEMCLKWCSQLEEKIYGRAWWSEMENITIVLTNKLESCFNEDPSFPWSGLHIFFR